jgi:hypothetical protein
VRGDSIYEGKKSLKLKEKEEMTKRKMDGWMGGCWMLVCLHNKEMERISPTWRWKGKWQKSREWSEFEGNNIGGRKSQLAIQLLCLVVV